MDVCEITVKIEPGESSIALKCKLRLANAEQVNAIHASGSNQIMGTVYASVSAEI